MSLKVFLYSLIAVFLTACGAQAPEKASTLTDVTTNGAETVDLMISVEKDAVAPADVEQAINDLNFRDASTGTCYAEAKVTDYIDYTAFDEEAPYYGVAFVDLTYNCAANGRAYAHRIVADDRYQIYSNPIIGGDPIFGVSN